MVSIQLAGRLVAAAFVLYAIGFAAARALAGTWFECGPSPAGRAAHRVLLGQLVLVLWLYLRSAVDAVTGGGLPLGRADAIVVFVILAVAARQRLRCGAGAALRADAPFLIPFTAALAVLAWLELPRVWMLSSDPDQHAFMVRQIQRLGALPYFTQRDWGSTDFGYPGGFAVLNFAWAELSGLDARDIVQAQGVIQALLAFQLLFEAAAAGPTKLTKAASTAVSTSLLAVFFLVLPYGYQRNLYHLEGTGRAACLLFVAGSLAMTLEAARRHRELGSTDEVRPVPCAVIAAALLAVAGLVNVIVVPYLALVATVAVGLLGRGRPLRERVGAFLVLACGPGLLFLDPYYIKRVFAVAPLHGGAAPSAPVTARPFLVSFFEAARAVLREPRTAVVQAFSTGILRPEVSGVAFAALAAAALLLARRRALTTAHVAAPAVAVGAIVAARMIVLPASLALSDRGNAFYLLPPYLEGVREQLMYVALAGILAAVMVGIARVWGTVATVALTCVLASVLCHPVVREGRLHRRPYAGAIGTTTKDDVIVIHQLERLYAEWRSRRVDAVPPPRILVPNLVLPGHENWLFPVGAGRVLPLYDVFPVAFFYFQGDPAFTYEAYVEHVCQSLDRRWLEARRIQYLFVPADRGDACVAELPSLLEGSGRILVRSGGAAVLDLSGDMAGR